MTVQFDFHVIDFRGVRRLEVGVLVEFENVVR